HVGGRRRSHDIASPLIRAYRFVRFPSGDADIRRSGTIGSICHENWLVFRLIRWLCLTIFDSRTQIEGKCPGLDTHFEKQRDVCSHLMNRHDQFHPSQSLRNQPTAKTMSATPERPNSARITWLRSKNPAGPRIVVDLSNA